MVKIEPQEPPRSANFAGKPRRVGVELEFAAVTARDAALRVRSTFGGTIEQVDRHLFEISGTELGDFEAKLDWQFLHDAEGRAPAGGESGWLASELQETLRGVLGDMASAIVPCEIVCPPVEPQALVRLDALLADLRRYGAQGTEANPLYAFGAQLNPDIAENSADYIVSILKAYLLLSDWLRAIISVDFTRRILTYTDPFPLGYLSMVTDPGYWPDMAELIHDYLRHNPVRNRELDLLPLFAWIDAETVRAAVPDKRIKARPTFHYRLPDARIGQSDWTVSTEWNRWCVVERLAERRDKLELMARAYRENQNRLIPRNWAILASEWAAMP